MIPHPTLMAFGLIIGCILLVFWARGIANIIKCLFDAWRDPYGFREMEEIARQIELEAWKREFGGNNKAAKRKP